MREGLLVDAFNLFHAARSSPHARFFPDIKRLAYLLEHFASSRGMRAVLVVDGSRFSDEWTDTPVLKVLCSAGGEPADAVMEAWMARLAPHERISWVLVSNDVNLGRMGAGMGLRVRPCAALAADLACFANDLPTHALDGHAPKRPGISKPFNNPFGRLSAVFFFAVSALMSPTAAAAEFGGFASPEAAVSDPVSGEVYVSNALPPPAQEVPADPAAPRPTRGFISKISGSGIVLIQRFIQGGPEGGGRELREPRGMAVSGGRLYVADGDKVRVYLTETGVLQESVQVTPDASADLSAPPVVLGPLAADRRGDVYAADLTSSRIFRIETRQRNRVTLFTDIEALRGPVGMALDPVTGHLFVVTRSSGQLVEIDRRRRAKVIKKGLGELNGMTMGVSGELYFSSASRGEIYRVTERGRGPITLAASGLRAPSGIGYSVSEHAILVPLKNDGRLTSVRLDRGGKNLIPKNFRKRPN
jgi:DNA-binding beta-propeller fold protein YncE